MMTGSLAGLKEETENLAEVRWRTGNLAEVMQRTGSLTEVRQRNGNLMGETDQCVFDSTQDWGPGTSDSSRHWEAGGSRYGRSSSRLLKMEGISVSSALSSQSTTKEIIVIITIVIIVTSIKSTIFIPILKFKVILKRFITVSPGTARKYCLLGKVWLRILTLRNLLWNVEVFIEQVGEGVAICPTHQV